nr:MAG TPA: adenine specific DNA methyltransferase [Caudoviricetes sp.]
MLKLNQLYNMDCMNGMREFSDKYFDLAIVDPPYGIGESGVRNCSRSKLAKARNYPGYYGGDLEPPSSEYFKELFRVSKNQIIWGANHYISRMPYDSPCWIVWDKVNGENDFADCELAWTSYKSAVRKVTFMWHGFLQGKSIDEGNKAQGNKKLNEKRIHPNQKPVAVYKWLLQKYAKPGYKILDTHVGSASSLIACMYFGCDYVGFEIDPYYYSVAKDRVDMERSQIKF